MGGPRSAKMSIGKRVSTWNQSRSQDVFPCLQMEPEISVAEWSRREKESIGKHIDFEDLKKGLFHLVPEGAGDAGHSALKLYGECPCSVG